MSGGSAPDGLKVLIVDDQSFVRRTIRLILRAVGRFRAEEADDGAARLALVPIFRLDLVQCDIHMPQR
jgi:CheY-like chemotaxis protein